VVSLAVLLGLSACAPPVPVIDPAATLLFVRSVSLYEHPLDVHFARPRVSAASRPLLVYATGDGGWRGKDEDLFEHLASFGYPVAGFSARTYLKNLGYVADTTTPARLAGDYERLIEFSRAALELPLDAPVVLVGVSRGAGLEVVAAGQHVVRTQISGVLAIALTREEEYVRHYRLRRDQAIAGVPNRELVMIETYDYLPRISLPVAVVQSTRDNYLPAARARELFGPDGPNRRFVAVDARDHSFGGAREELYEQVRLSLDWISARIASGPPRGQARVGR
jgi:pimeloyl-ACP methyl ester carboxylesterase